MSVSEVKTKKNFNIGDFLMSIIPLLIMLCLNTAATIPAMIVGFMENRDSLEGGTFDPLLMLSGDNAQLALSIGFICYAIISITLFGIWYKKSFLKDRISVSNKEVFTVKKIVIAIIGMLGFWSIANLYVNLLQVIAPSFYESYETAMNSAGFGSNWLTTIFYVCTLGPIAEEFIFRGVTQAYLKRSGAAAPVVIIVQAILFGIAHMNFVQSTYAAVLGLFLGLLAYKYGNIRICCLAHMANNTASVVIPMIFSALGLQETASTVFFVTMSVIGLVISFFLLKTPTRNIDKVAVAA